jgi:very-short-patch-repair endonuclease
MHRFLSRAEISLDFWPWLLAGCSGVGSRIDDADIVARARELRARPTGAEHQLRRALLGAGEGRIRRQLVVGRMILDLALPLRNLLIELDGGSHTDPDRDFRRDAYLESLGFRVLRIPNGLVLDSPDAVVAVIHRYPQTKANRDQFFCALRLARIRARAGVKLLRSVLPK